jgi:hypothetical protein
MRQLGHISQTGDLRKARTTLVERCNGKNLLGRYKGRRENNIQIQINRRLDLWEFTMS